MVCRRGAGGEDVHARGPRGPETDRSGASCICTRSREKIWTQQTIAERVQIIAAQMVRPQTLKSRFLRAPLASSQVELRATFSSWPHSGQGLCRGIGGQHTQTFPSCVGVQRARQPGSEQTHGFLPSLLTPSFQVSLLKSHHGALSEVPSQLSILTGENRASHAKHDTEHRKQGEERDH